tara:strand:- start:590 stop:967 length:378 start_codon:yes stop_codon:yes gene_type:complete
MINQYDYYCPKCKGKLNEDSKVILNVCRTDKSKSKIYLDPKPHSYNLKCEPEIEFKKNEIVDFLCPNCNANLKSVEYEKFVQITLKVTEGVFFDIFFSRVYSDHRTYVGIEDFKEEYGDRISTKE